MLCVGVSLFKIKNVPHRALLKITTYFRRRVDFSSSRRAFSNWR